MNYKISDADKVLFRNSQRQTRRLKTNNKVVWHKPRTLDKQVVESTHMICPAADHSFDVAKVSGTTALTFQHSGVQPRMLRQLRQGKLPPEKTLDLHGLTIIEAEDRLIDFLNHCSKQRIRIISIVHGKGNNSKQPFPPLKNFVNQFLRRHRSVLAFTSAPLRGGGGTGAVYVLLKRNRH